MTQNKIEQNNTYIIYDSMGRKTDNYIIASNIIEARIKAKEIAKEKKLDTFYIVKRAYNGGVRG